MTFVRFDTSEAAPAFIDPNTVRGFLPSRYGSDCTLLVIDGGVKLHVKGHDPASAFAALSPAGELGFRAADGATSPTLDWVRSVSARMESRLADNRHKGDRPGWLKQPPADLLAALKKNVADLERAVSGEHPDSAWRAAADIANLAGMAADAYEQSKR